MISVQQDLGTTYSGPRATVVLSGGAPYSPLAAAALAAIYDAGKTFTTFYTSGAGATVGLLYLAPLDGRTVPESLKSVLDVGIDNRIYDIMSIPYKTFFKSGPWAPLFATWARAFHLPEIEGHGGDLGLLRNSRHFRRLYNDTLDFWAALLAPTDLNFYSEGLCQPFPFITEMVDFSKLAQYKGNFFMNALNIDTQCMEIFGNETITCKHFDAALAFPFIYPPAKVDEHYYFEGSTQDPLALSNMVRHVYPGGPMLPDEFFVLIDVFGPFGEKLIRRPENLLDALGISIMCPIIALAEATLQLFSKDKQNPTLTNLTFDLTGCDVKHVSEFSHSNLHKLWKIGYTAGANFVKQYGDKMPDHAQKSPSPVYPDVAQQAS
jgi:NTE family protein